MTKHTALSEGSSQVVNRELGLLIMDPKRSLLNIGKATVMVKSPGDGRPVGKRSPQKLYRREFTYKGWRRLHSTIPTVCLH